MGIEDNSLDNFFRNKALAEAEEPGFDEEAWELMNLKLDKKERLIFFRNSSIVLLLLFIGFGPCFLNMDVAFVGQIQIVKNHKTKINDEKNISEINQYK
jgi:hypothetical protein